MTKTIIKVVVIVIIFVSIGYGVYYFTTQKSAEEENVPTDTISLLLLNLEKQTGIDFSKIQDEEVKWMGDAETQVQEAILQGKGFEAERISDQEFRSVAAYLKDQGFAVDVANLAAGTIAALTGYQKNNLVCLVVGGATGYKEATGGWIPPEPDLKDVTVKCARLTIDEEIGGEKVYSNEKYNYSFYYPASCTLGPLPGECKQLSPEERDQDCLCTLNAENPDQVVLQAFTGPQDNLAGASFSVSHYSSAAYNPPVDTDLIDWLQENFSYQNIPNQTNMEIDATPAVKVYTPASPQAFSQQDIYFLKNNLLFNISMLDVDNQDNRQLYDEILASFELASKDTLPAQADKIFKITLDANPTTGYEWQADYSTNFLELVSQEFQPGQPGLVGAAGQQVFEFKALKTGESQITFSYLRAWEDELPIEKKIYEVDIE